MRAPAGLSMDGLARVAATPGVVALDGDVALVCPVVGAGTDSGTSGGCDAAIVDPAGALRGLGRDDLAAAVRIDPDRIVVLTVDHRLVILGGAGGERELSARAADPRAAGPGRVVFTELRGDGIGIDPATTGRLVVMDLDRGTRRVVTDHPMDSAPFAVPGSDDVVFVSARTGLASVWLAQPGRPPRQLTNVGRRRVDAEFVPVPGRELAWLPGTRIAIFTAHYGAPALWALDIDTGRASRLGPGRLPRAQGAGVIAVDAGGAVIDPAAVAAAVARDGAR